MTLPRSTGAALDAATIRMSSLFDVDEASVPAALFSADRAAWGFLRITSSGT
jgi:hypothetical protein